MGVVTLDRETISFEFTSTYENRKASRVGLTGCNTSQLGPMALECVEHRIDGLKWSGRYSSSFDLVLQDAIK